MSGKSVQMLAAAAALVGALLLYAPSAAAEPLRTTKPAELITAGGLKLTLPPSFIYSEEDHAKLDAEIVRLQNTETRLAAENKVLRADARDHLGAWWPVIIAGATGIIAGAFFF